MRPVESSKWPRTRLMVPPSWRDYAQVWTICPTYCVAPCDGNHPLMALGVQCFTLNTQAMTHGFARHLGKSARSAGFVAALARFATASARGCANGAATDLPMDWTSND